MFTIKYIYPSGQEGITGPYELVSAEWVDSSGNHVDPHTRLPGDDRVIHQVVYGYKQLDDGISDITPSGRGATMTYGPNIPLTSDVPMPRVPGRVYVMNEHGATVAKYEL